MPSIVLINAVGLTQRLLPFAPRLSKLGWNANMLGVLPAVTCTAQATLLTGTTPDRHGIVANGWHFRDTNEVRFWQQSNSLMQAEPIYTTLKKLNPKFTTAKLFWWFNQGANVDYSVTPKPWYALNGDKRFDIATTPIELGDGLKNSLGDFPFPSFWGPNAGLPSSDWIARSSAKIIRDQKPNLTLVYLPHLDYEPQRFGPSGCDMNKCVAELDQCAGHIIDAANEIGAQVWVVSEYGHCDVKRPIEINRYLRKNGFLKVRHGPFGEQLDLYGSAAFAVVDHQLAHISVRDPNDIGTVREMLSSLPGISKMYVGPERAKIHLDHPRSGEIIALADSDAWFAYSFWLDDSKAPDYARSVAIHHKPGFDPCELFLDPQLTAPKLQIAGKLLQKKLGFRTTFNVIPLDHSIVKGSHGHAASNPLDRPILIGHGPSPGESVPMTSVKQLLINSLVQ